MTSWEKPARLVSEKDGDEPLSALVKPLPGHTDQEVMAALAEMGATEVGMVAGGIVSTHAPVAVLEAISRIAVVQIKPLHKLRLA
jgi:hypothetical protein